ncbi:2OG-Fe(II) oxygenase [Streptomyces sp. ISL-11]|uniref:2OG-Fe(II) oxygenase n=1 Tax=Streptomyces sp. ISL-11 TaxID=2819174 RepID=UPI001BE4EE4F|nr:2OG-Fe(II) oxygenase [Streptomyces sp. ISL-11]MBT2386642.1 2OG-Fe(II) oxygenase [Streptomyces sp. ISL-11]
MLRTTTEFTKAREGIAAHVATDVLSESDIRELDAAYPSDDHFEKVVFSSPVKRFRLRSLPLSRDGERLPAAERLPTVWSRLLDDLDGPEFTARLGEVTGMELAGLPRDTGLFTHAEGEFISLHHDQPEKALTVVLYFNRDWPADGGGHFEVRATHNPTTAPASSLPPAAGTAIAFDSSVWHATSTVTTGRTLRAAVLDFWRDRPQPR